jgi:hypothetical protein
MFTGSSVSGVTLDGVRIANPGNHVVAIRSTGSATFSNLRVAGLKAPAILACNPGFRLTSDLKTRTSC